MRVWICGVRGSTPAVGVEYAVVGGHTSCVAIGDDNGSPRLVLDAGTGLRQLTKVLEGAPFRGTILLSHLHWDHTQGLPFFASGDRPDASVRLVLPEQGRPANELLERVLSPPHFPITVDELRGSWTVESLDAVATTFEGYDVLARDVPHKGGRTFGYRVSDGECTIAYLPDHAPQNLGRGPSGLGELHAAAIELVQGADLLFHDAQYSAAELPTRGAFGHAAFEYAVELASAANVRTLMLFHHDPLRTDDEVESFLEAARHHAGDRVVVDIARQGTNRLV